MVTMWRVYFTFYVLVYYYQLVCRESSETYTQHMQVLSHTHIQQADKVFLMPAQVLGSDTWLQRERETERVGTNRNYSYSEHELEQ